MSKLYFKYGTMGCGKSTNMLMMIHNYETQGFKVICLKPSADTRNNTVYSRINMEKECMHISPEDNIEQVLSNREYDILAIDEVQFLTEDQITQLYHISRIPGKTVMCYSLLTDFQRNLFKASAKLISYNAHLEEFKYMCKCGKKAVINARYKAGKICKTGNIIAIESEEYEYKALCEDCYENEIEN